MLFLLVFITEWALLMVEMAAFKMFAPYFGSSLYIWGNIIGIVMIGASLGYWFGGRIADKIPQKKILILIVLFAGVFIISIPFLFFIFLRFFDIKSNLLFFSFFFGIPLFGIPAFLIELAPPFATRILNKDLQTTGKSIGSIYGFSTIGGILGIIMASLITLPFWGVKETFLFAGGILIFFALLFLLKEKFNEKR